MSANEPVILTVAADPSLARLVRMTASNVAMLSSMSVERVEDIRMAAEEAFVYADLILTAVCDSYEKRDDSSSLVLTLKADVA